MTPTFPANPALNTAIARARALWDGMTEAEREAMLRKQRISYARGEMAIGSDFQEAQDRADLASDDKTRRAFAAERINARVTRFTKALLGGAK